MQAWRVWLRDEVHEAANHGYMYLWASGILCIPRQSAECGNCLRPTYMPTVLQATYTTKTSPDASANLTTYYTKGELTLMLTQIDVQYDLQPRTRFARTPTLGGTRATAFRELGKCRQSCFERCQHNHQLEATSISLITQCSREFEFSRNPWIVKLHWQRYERTSKDFCSAVVFPVLDRLKKKLL